MRMLTRLVIFALIAASISGQPLQGRSQKTELLAAVSILKNQAQDIKQKVVDLQNSGALCPYPYKQVLDECFFLSKISLNWDKARRHCQGMQGDLATPRNVYALKSFIIDTAAEVTEAWLGGTEQSSEGTWTWLDGRPIADWADGQPEDDREKDCLDIRLEWHPPLNDYQCGASHRFVCQYKG